MDLIPLCIILTHHGPVFKHANKPRIQIITTRPTTHQNQLLPKFIVGVFWDDGDTLRKQRDTHYLFIHIEIDMTLTTYHTHIDHSGSYMLYCLSCNFQSTSLENDPALLCVFTKSTWTSKVRTRCSMSSQMAIISIAWSGRFICKNTKTWRQEHDVVSRISVGWLVVW